MIKIRHATVDDARGILGIYSYYVENTAITFEWNVPTIDEFRERILSISKKYPYIVAVDEERIVGYSYLNTYRERESYAWCAELSMYVDKDARKSGIGSALLKEIERLAKKQHILKLISCIAASEEDDPDLPKGSLEFHDRSGFKDCGYIRNAGFKSGKWWNLAIKDKDLAEYNSNPPGFIT